jgi:hypothetical protein
LPAIFLRGVEATVSYRQNLIIAILLTPMIADESTLPPRRFLINVDSTLEALQKQEDTDANMQITIEDNGPKVSLLKLAMVSYR